MKKFCIFCGENPTDKNKEHIIPQWLIRMTDKPDRKTIVGTNSQGKELTIPWNRFVFPACEECNTNFGKIEGQVRAIVEKLLDEKQVNHSEMDLFLDWLDKVRIGLWLGQLIHKKIEVDPKFYINQRVGEKDRICIMYKIDDNEKGINVTGTEFSLFHLIPSCFSLTINHLCFFSYSKEFILSENIGFPFMSKYKLIDEGKMEVEEFDVGKAEVAKRILEGTILKPSVRFYQSILSFEHGLVKPRIGRKGKFYKNNCMTFIRDKVKSRILLGNDFGERGLNFWPNKKKHAFSGQQELNRVLIEHFTAKMVLEHQIQSALKFDAVTDDDLIDGFEDLIEENRKSLIKIDTFLKQAVPEYYR
jgi:hypothetical protein